LSEDQAAAAEPVGTAPEARCGPSHGAENASPFGVQRRRLLPMHWRPRQTVHQGFRRLLRQPLFRNIRDVPPMVLREATLEIP